MKWGGDSDVFHFLLSFFPPPSHLISRVPHPIPITYVKPHKAQKAQRPSQPPASLAAPSARKPIRNHNPAPVISRSINLSYIAYPVFTPTLLLLPWHVILPNRCSSCLPPSRKKALKKKKQHAPHKNPNPKSEIRNPKSANPENDKNKINEKSKT
jgi:hypothetical protein